MTTTAYRTCPLCEATCGLELTLVDGAVVRVAGDADDVFSRGFICPKGAMFGALDADPDRLRRPLVRRGGTHVEVGWDEAFARVAELLGPILTEDRNAVAVYLGNPNVHNLAGQFYVRPLVKALGTRTVFSASTVDQMPKHVSSGHMFGHPATIAVPDLDRTSHLLLLGANPYMSNGSLATAPDFPGRIQAIRRRGGKVVVIDPRRTRTAMKADEHVPIRPGTDPYLLLAMIAVVAADGAVDLGHLAPHTAGLDAMLAAAAAYPPERVAPITGVDPATITRLAREFAAAPSAVAYGRIGTHTVPFGTLAAWLVDVLNAVTANLDRPGGAMFPLAAHTTATARPRGFRTGRWASRVRGLPEILGELPAAALAEEIDVPGEGRIRALVTIAGNPVVSTPNAARLDRALTGLEAMVSVDAYLNETTRHADVILPAEPSLARGHYDAAFYGLAVRNVANYSPPVRALAADERPEWETLTRLAQIASGLPADTPATVGDDVVVRALVDAAVADADGPVAGRDPEELLAALAPRVGPERILDHLLRVGAYGDGYGARPDGLSLDVLERHPHGIDLGPLEPRLPAACRNADRRIDLAPAPFLADLDRLSAAADRFVAAPFLLVGRRHLRSNNSWMHNVDGLTGGTNRCTLQVHPDDAAELAVEDGGSVRVASRVGEVVAEVEVTDTLMPGVVSLPHGWGHALPGTRLGVAAKDPGVNSNLLTDEADVDLLSGNAVLNAIPVTLAPA